jgi:choline-glycine betaine transporter
MFNLNEGLLKYVFNNQVPYIALFGSLLLVLLVAYFLGSINSAILISNAIYKEDIRT